MLTLQPRAVTSRLRRYNVEVLGVLVPDFLSISFRLFYFFSDQPTENQEYAFESKWKKMGDGLVPFEILLFCRFNLNFRTISQWLDARSLSNSSRKKCKIADSSKESLQMLTVYACDRCSVFVAIVIGILALNTVVVVQASTIDVLIASIFVLLYINNPCFY